MGPSSLIFVLATNSCVVCCATITQRASAEGHPGWPLFYMITSTHIYFCAPMLVFLLETFSEAELLCQKP